MGCENLALAAFSGCCKDAASYEYWILHRFRKPFETMHHANGVPACYSRNLRRKGPLKLRMQQ